ncbi:Chloramphenicol acetyltransferase-like domain-containing protein [Cynara cardunculus var. scolymus]|uniref:Chloramphenicol acetyltransferase-like domain-containing protein n=1 Tax=Cynara cardunculus var. scolymus TaxID=59895 RepID=A0A103Y2Q3_CYNCS|nr:Chloramphenicol acetyltransferase-like domain-containing protein [Cynara cardunculus var. scolymus]
MMGSIGMLTVSVKQTDIIMAATPVQNLWLPMSNLDLLIPPLDVGVFFCYRKPMDHGDENSCIINLIEQSLSLALVHFYPLAGEVVYTSQGEPELLCNNHADAHSMNMFLASWAEIQRSKPVSCLPSFRRSVLHPRRPPLITSYYDTLYVPFSSLPPSPTSDLTNPLISRIYYIEANDVNNLQAVSSLDGNPQSKLISFISLLWKIIAEGDDDSTTCRMGVVVDGRERLNDIANFENPSNIDSFTMENYFGNVLSISSGEASSDDLKEMPLSQVAKMVHKFVSGTKTKEHFRGLIDWVEVHRPEKAVTKIYTRMEDNDGGAVVVSSGMRFQMEKIDFGWGKPQFGSYHFPWGGQTGYVMPMPSVTKNGDWVVYMHLLQKHLDLVEAMGTKYFRPLTATYLGF